MARKIEPREREMSSAPEVPDGPSTFGQFFLTSEAVALIEWTKGLRDWHSRP